MISETIHDKTGSKNAVMAFLITDLSLMSVVNWAFCFILPRQIFAFLQKILHASFLNFAKNLIKGHYEQKKDN